MKKVPSVRSNIIANFAGKAWPGIFSLAFVPFYVKIMGVEVSSCVVSAWFAGSLNIKMLKVN